MAFTFRLDSIFSYRKSLEEQAQLKLAREEAELRQSLDRLEALKNERRGLVDELEERKRTGISGALFLFYSELLNVNEHRRNGQNTVVNNRRRAVAMARKALLEKVKDRKILERLRERDLLQYQRNEAGKEMKDSDEQAVLRYGRDDSLL